MKQSDWNTSIRKNQTEERIITDRNSNPTTTNLFNTLSEVHFDFEDLPSREGQNKKPSFAETTRGQKRNQNSLKQSFQTGTQHQRSTSNQTNIPKDTQLSQNQANQLYTNQCHCVKKGC